MDKLVTVFCEDNPFEIYSSDQSLTPGRDPIGEKMSRSQYIEKWISIESGFKFCGYFHNMTTVMH